MASITQRLGTIERSTEYQEPSTKGRNPKRQIPNHKTPGWRFWLLSASICGFNGSVVPTGAHTKTHTPILGGSGSYPCSSVCIRGYEGIPGPGRWRSPLRLGASGFYPRPSASICGFKGSVVRTLRTSQQMSFLGSFRHREPTGSNGGSMPPTTPSFHPVPSAPACPGLKMRPTPFLFLIGGSPLKFSQFGPMKAAPRRRHACSPAAL